MCQKDNDPHGNERAPTVDPRVALKYVQGWVPWLNELIKNTPDMGAIDYKLLWRDPSPTWASKHARVVQIGDAAHAFLPTSAAGATMAMEDGFSLATCLQLGGKSNVALAVKIHNELRYVECPLLMTLLTLLLQIQKGYLRSENGFQKSPAVPRVHFQTSG